MTTYERGDVLLVPFPFSDQSKVKKRPAVIISSNSYNSLSSDLIIMAITSQIEKSIATGEGLIDHWAEAGLLKPSVVKPAISTLEQRLILKKPGHFSVKGIDLIDTTLKELLNLT